MPSLHRESTDSLIRDFGMHPLVNIKFNDI